MTKTAPVSTSAVTAARQIRIVTGRLRRRFRRAYDSEGLSPSQTSALSRLDKNGPASISDLAAEEQVRHQSMAATLGELEKRGFVERRPDPDDGRRQLMSASASGSAFLNDKRRAGEEWLARALQDRFSDTERRQLLHAFALLERLTQ